jgi:hypothetical protein
MVVIGFKIDLKTNKKKSRVDFDYINFWDFDLLIGMLFQLKLVVGTNY